MNKDGIKLGSSAGECGVARYTCLCRARPLHLLQLKRTETGVLRREPLWSASIAHSNKVETNKLQLNSAGLVWMRPKFSLKIIAYDRKGQSLWKEQPVRRSKCWESLRRAATLFPVVLKMQNPSISLIPRQPLRRHLFSRSPPRSVSHFSRAETCPWTPWKSAAYLFI